eukprot:s2580_g2.t1
MVDPLMQLGAEGTQFPVRFPSISAASLGSRAAPAMAPAISSATQGSACPTIAALSRTKRRGDVRETTMQRARILEVNARLLAEFLAARLALRSRHFGWPLAS